MSPFHALSICTAAAVLMVSPAVAAPWSNDLDAALRQAATEDKLVLVEFTGSDWCSYCIKLDCEVLSTPAFAEYIAPRFIPVRVDVPIQRDFDRTLLARNQELCRRYRVPGYPTLMVLTPQGQVVGGFCGDPGKGIEGAKQHLTAAQKFARMLAEAEALQGANKAVALHRVYSAQQPAMRPATGLRERIAELDTQNVTGIHNELKIEQEREVFRRELAAAREPRAALGVIERHLPAAAPQNRTEMLQAKAAVLMALAKDEADILVVKALLLELADQEGDSAERTKRIIEQRFSDPSQVLEHLRNNPPMW